MSSLLSQLESCKAAGNILFSSKKYVAAREKYTEGISLLPSSSRPPLTDRNAVTLASTLYSNRALCSKFMGDWTVAESDARSAMSLDRLNAKSHYVLGLALRARGSLADATARLERALDMARRQKRGLAMESQFEGAAAAARSAWYTASNAAEDRADLDLETVCLSALLRAGQPSVTKAIIIEGECPLYSSVVLPAIDDSRLSSSIISSSNSNSESSELLQSGQSTKDVLASDQIISLFAGRRKSRSLRIVPQWAQDPITFDIMLDPVIGPTGISYERRSIESCLKVKQNECPVTRAPLVASSLFPNRALKTAISAWLNDNPWAHPAAEAEGEL